MSTYNQIYSFEIYGDLRWLEDYTWAWMKWRYRKTAWTEVHFKPGEGEILYPVLPILLTSVSTNE